MKKILVYGYGNPGRQDDGLGIILAEQIALAASYYFTILWAKEKGYDTIDADSNYQLNIEDAYALNEYDVVIYADASIEDIDSFILDKIEPQLNTNFSMHSVSPAFVIGVCKELYNEIPDSYLLHIKGYEWEFMTDMSEKAKRNLEEASVFLKNKLESIIN